MADAIPPAPTTVLPALSGAAGPVAVTVVSDGAAMAKLLDGALLEAQVQGRAAGGTLEVLTANGLLQIKAPPGTTLPPLAAGAKLLLQLVGQDGGGQLQILAVNGRALGGLALPAGPAMAGLLALPTGQSAAFAMAGGGSGAASGPAGAGVAGPATLGPAAAGSSAPAGLTATLIRPALAPGMANPGAALPGLPDSGGLPPDLPAGTRLTVRIAGTIAAAEGLPLAPMSAPPAAGATATTPTAGGIPGGPAAPAPLPLPADTAAAAANPGRLAGIVTAHPPGGHAVVQSPIGTLAVPTPADVTVGSRIVLDVVGPPVPPPPSPPAAATPPQGLGPQGWPALGEALEVLAGANQPQALEQLLRSIPQADTRLAASMAVFTGALRDGRARGLLSEDGVRGLEKAGRKDLATRLRADLEALGDDAGRPVAGGDWRAYTLPFLSNGFVEPIRLFVREPGGDEAGAKAGGRNNDQRFLLDLNLTNLGRLQLDGLVRRDDKLFDLIIRTGQPLTAEMRRDILGIFANAGELVGTKGTVAFQAGGRWVEFPPPPPPPTRIEA